MATSDSEPLLRGSVKDTARGLLDSARDDAPETGARDRMLVALAATPPTSGSRLREALRAGSPSVYGLAIVLVLSTGASLAVLSTSWRSRSTVSVVPPSRELAAPLESAVPVHDMGNDMANTPAPGVMPVVALDTLPDAPISEPVANPRAPSKWSQHAAPALSAPPGPRESTLAREIAKVEAARASLKAGDARSTLTTLDEYDREFPTGAFAVEIAVLRIEALARADRTDEARRLGTEFLTTHRHGAFARRVAITLEGTNAHRPAGSSND